MWVQSLGQEDLLEEGMAAHSSILAWRVPWTKEPGGLESMQGHKESDTTEVTQHALVQKAVAPVNTKSLERFFSVRRNLTSDTHLLLKKKKKKTSHFLLL